MKKNILLFLTGLFCLAGCKSTEIPEKPAATNAFTNVQCYTQENYIILRRGNESQTIRSRNVHDSFRFFSASQAPVVIVEASDGDEVALLKITLPEIGRKLVRTSIKTLDSSPVWNGQTVRITKVFSIGSDGKWLSVEYLPTGSSEKYIGRINLWQNTFTGSKIISGQKDKK